MLKNIGKIMFKKLTCKIFGHSLFYAGQCPFTGLRYSHCVNCDMMIPWEEDELQD